MPIKKRWSKYDSEHISKAPGDRGGVYELADKNKKTTYIGGSRKSVRSRLEAHKSEKKHASAEYFRQKPEHMLDDGISMEKSHSQKYATNHSDKPKKLQRSPRKPSIWDI
jgi:predicted GIY-YIG superfamily endonuclease